MTFATRQADEAIKLSCACAYESEAARLLIGESLHPGGLELTARLGDLLRLGPQSRVLDIASGTGASALFLSKRFGCSVQGIDYSPDNVDRANARATTDGFGGHVVFTRADAEMLPFGDDAFDAVLCECAFCLFPNKVAAAHEMARVLAPGGRVAISDLTRKGTLPAATLSSLLAWVACLGDARPSDGYADYLRQAGLTPELVEQHDEALLELARQIQLRLLGAQMIAEPRKAGSTLLEVMAGQRLAREAIAAIKQGQLGYAVICAQARKSAPISRRVTIYILAHSTGAPTG